MSKLRLVGFEAPKLDEDLSREGAWFPIGNGVGEVRVRPITNPDFQRYYEAKRKPYRRQIDAGNLDEGIARKILASALARHVITDWRGLVQDAKGKDVPFSVDVAEELLSDPENDLLVGWVFTVSRDQGAFQKADDEEAAETLGND